MMSAKDNAMTTVFDRLCGLLGWWGLSSLSGNGSLEARVERFRTFAFDLQKAYAEASEHEMKALLTANERLATSLLGLLRSRSPQEMTAAQSDILAVLMDGVSLRAKAWTDLAEKTQACCIAMTRNSPTEVDKSTDGGGNIKLSAKPAHRSDQRLRPRSLAGT